MTKGTTHVSMTIFIMVMSNLLSTNVAVLVSILTLTYSGYTYRLYIILYAYSTSYIKQTRIKSQMVPFLTVGHIILLWYYTLCTHLYMYAMNMHLRNFLNLLFGIFKVFNEFVAEGHSIILAIWTGAFRSIFNVSTCTLLQH